MADLIAKVKARCDEFYGSTPYEIVTQQWATALVDPAGAPDGYMVDFQAVSTP